MARNYGEYETFWAREVGGGEFELRSVPMWVSGLAWGDVVTATARSPNDRPLVDGVARRGGHSTVLLGIEKTALGKPFERAWKALGEEGCGWDAMSETLRAIDIPPEANQRKVSKALEWGRVNEIWTYDALHIADHAP